MQRHTHAARPSRMLPACHGTARLHVCCSFSFANSERAAKAGSGRKNRQLEKRQEQQLRSVAHGLCDMNAKQLAAVSHLLLPEHLAQVRIGMDIPKTNQGRKRQAGLVMKLLRVDLDAPTLAKLAAAVAAATQHNAPFADADVEQQLELWMEGLAAGDEDVVAQVFELLQAQQQDWQQVRQCVRQLQQHEQDQQQAQQQPATSSGGDDTSSSLSVSPDGPAEAAAAVADPEVLQLMQELSAQQQQQQQQPGTGNKGGRKRSSSSSSSSSTSATAARRTLRRLLRPHAVALHSTAAGAAGGGVQG